MGYRFFFALLAALGACSTGTPDTLPDIEAPAFPPLPPTNAPAADGSAPKVFAITKLFVGTTDRNGVQSADAWRHYGYELDGQLIYDPHTHCQPVGSASFQKGAGGRDNSWGRNLLPIFVSAVGTSNDYQAQVNAPIKSGALTLLLDLPTLGAKSTYVDVGSFELEGMKDTAAGWSLVPNTLAGATANTALAAFPSSYLTHNTWVSGGDATVVVPWVLLGFGPLRLTVHHAIISMDLADDHNAATNGTIAGVLNTEEFVTDLRGAIGAFQSSLCGSTTLEGILKQLRGASDIMSDGTQDPTKTCDGISIGLGFNAAATSLGPLGTPIAYPDPCAAPGG